MNLFWRVYFQTCQEIRERTTNLQGSNDKLEADLTDCHNEVQKLKKQLEAMWMNYDGVSACDDEELMARRALRTGDRVLVQSGASGELPTPGNMQASVDGLSSIPV